MVVHDSQDDLLSASAIAALVGCDRSTVHRNFGKPNLPVAATDPRRVKRSDAIRFGNNVKRTYRSNVPLAVPDIERSLRDAFSPPSVQPAQAADSVSPTRAVGAPTAYVDLEAERDRWKALAESYRLALRELLGASTHSRAESAALTRTVTFLLDADEVEAQRAHPAT